MDARVNQLSRELTDAISAAVAEDSRVKACREKASSEGLDLRLTLEAVISFVDRSGDAGASSEAEDTSETPAPARQPEMSANDRRFLKSLRISADEPTEKVD
ncbi:MAG: hypothetical protein ACYTGR_15455 [Planctomycetota bacterium]|jgi:hypothetical protein